MEARKEQDASTQVVIDQCRGGRINFDSAGATLLPGENDEEGHLEDTGGASRHLLKTCTRPRARAWFWCTCRRKQQIFVTRNKESASGGRFPLGGVISTVPDEPLSGEQRYPYYHRPSRRYTEPW